jgi:hypothetical protein
LLLGIVDNSPRPGWPKKKKTTAVNRQREARQERRRRRIDDLREARVIVDAVAKLSATIGPTPRICIKRVDTARWPATNLTPKPDLPIGAFAPSGLGHLLSEDRSSFCN